MRKESDKILRIICLCIMMFCGFVAIVYRLIDLSYCNRQKYLNEINRTHKFQQFIDAKRGNIFDRNGEIIATSIRYVEVGIDAFSANIKKDKIKIEKLAEILNMDEPELLKNFSRKKLKTDDKIKKVRWVKIAEVFDMTIYEMIKSLRIKGVSCIVKERRNYSNGSMFCHITGYVNKDDEAVCGVERFMDFYLKGQSGFFEAEKDGQQNELVQYRSNILEAKDGCDVILSVDARIQSILYSEVNNLVQEYSPNWVCIIASDAKSGEILGLVNSPYYDPNEYWLTDFQSMRNRAISDVYEPGSVFKIVSASLALEAGVASEDTMFDCSQDVCFYNNRKVRLPSDHHSLGRLTMTEVLRKSSNRGAAMLAMKLGDERFYNGVRSFGFGEKIGYGFDSEVSGLLNPISKWDGLTISRIPMGHSISVTPMQVHFAMSVLASDGILFSPQLFKEIKNEKGSVFLFSERVKRSVISKQTAIRMRKMLFNLNNKSLKNGINYCGKTGTSQKIINGQYSHDRHVAGFSGFFPVEEPKIVLTIVVDDAHVDSGIAWGSRISVPSFVRVANKIIDFLGM